VFQFLCSSANGSAPQLPTVFKISRTATAGDISEISATPGAGKAETVVTMNHEATSLS